MTQPVSIDALKAGLVARLDELVTRLFPNAALDGAEWRLGDVFGAPGRSLGIHRTGAKAGVWRDFASGAGGDVLDLVAAGACHGDVKEAIGWARNFLGYGALDEGERRRIEAQAERTRAAVERKAHEEAERKRRYALALFLNARPAIGTPAERYLLGRAIDLRALGLARGRPLGSFRFAPLRDRDAGFDRPCLICPLVSPAGEHTGIHRTFLTVLEDGRVVKATQDPEAPMADCKLSLGTVRGSFIPLYAPSGARRFSAVDGGEDVLVTEGVEDGLSAAAELPGLRVIATVSLDNAARLGRTLARFRTVFWHRHRETSEAAAARGEQVSAALRRQGCNLTEVWAPDGHKDFNEAAMAAAEAARRAG